MIYYWKGAKGGQNLLVEFKQEISDLINNRYNSSDLEKLKSSSKNIIYSYRINYSDRLLFTTVNGYLYVIEHIPNHDYQKSRFLKSGVLRNYLQKHAENDEPLFFALDEDEQLDLLVCESEFQLASKGFDQYNRQFISLSGTQSDHIETASLPLVLHGAAGSGKTYMSFSMLQQNLEPTSDEIKRCLYITKERELASSMRDNWQDSFLPGLEESEGFIEFKTYEELLADFGIHNIVSRDHFSQWFLSLKNIGSLPIDAEEEYYQEFRICAALNRREYEVLGERQSTIPRGEGRKVLYDLYQQYINYLDGCIDASLFNPLVGVEAYYDFIVVDEANRLSLIQNLTLANLAKDKAIVYCLDALQNVEEICSTRNLLEAKLRDFSISSITLNQTYRCSKQVSYALDTILNNNRIILGGKLDKDEALEMAVYDEAEDGEVYRFSPAQIMDESHWLYERAKSTQFAVVTTEHYLDEARDKFKTGLVFTPKQIQGQEFHTIVVYKLLSNSKSKKILKPFRKIFEEDTAAPKNRSKNKTNSPNGKWAHEIYTACSRAKHTLAVIDEDNIYWKKLRLNSSKTNMTPVTLEPSSKEDWEKMAIEQQRFNNLEIAETINSRLLSEMKSLSVESNSVICQPIHYDEKLSLDLHKMIKSRQLRKVRRLLNDPAVDVNIMDPNDKKMTPIIRAVTDGNLEMVKLLLTLGDRIKLDATQEYGITPLQIAASKGFYEIVEVLLQVHEKIGLNQPNIENGPTALMFSACERHSKIADLIINTPGCDLNVQESEGNTALIMATSNSEVKIVKSLIEAGCDLNLVNKSGDTALMMAVKAENKEIIQLLLDQKQKLELNARGESGLNALMLACQFNFVEIVNLLLAQPGINVNQRNYENGPTAILVAASEGNLQIAQALIGAGADVDMQDKKGCTALMVAAANDHVAVAQLLINVGANINLTDNERHTALIFACRNNHVNTVEVIVSNPKCDPNFMDEEGKTALISAVDNNNLEVTQLLIQYGQNLNLDKKAKDIGPTALLYAVYHGNMSIVKVLIEAGSNVNTSDHADHTALMIAFREEHNDIARFLLENVTDIKANMKNSYGNTALSFLIEQDPIDRSLLSVLLKKEGVIQMVLTCEYQAKDSILESYPDLVSVLIELRELSWHELKNYHDTDLPDVAYKQFLREIYESTSEGNKFHELHKVFFKTITHSGFFPLHQNELVTEIKEYIESCCDMYEDNATEGYHS